MRLFAFAASFRSASLNHKLISLAARLAAQEGAEVDLARFREFDMPLYDGDEDVAHGLPDGARKLKERIERAAGLMIAVPEYNYSIPGPLKNAIDWVSRARPMPWRGRAVYLMATAPSAVGGVRGLWQTRIPLEGCGAIVFPDMFALPHGNTAFDERGFLREHTPFERLLKEVRGFVRFAEAVEPLCCAPPAVADAKQRAEQIAAALEEESELQPAAP
jgi:chromate reductase, NAD(P)H dehydrogenase (quinone)